MKKLDDLTPAVLRAQLKHPGIYLRTTPFITHLQTPISALTALLQLLYADFFLEDHGELADFHVRIAPPRGMRRWLRPQTLFVANGIAPFQPLARHLALPLLEWGLNWCVATSAHQYLVIHAAVVERDAQALILPAPPGSGKSTLCAALVHCGWRLLSDELTLVRLEDGDIQPFPRPVGLKERSIQVIRDFAPNACIGPDHVQTHKGTVAHMRPPSESVAQAEQPATPAWVVFPAYQVGAPVELTPWPKARAFMRVADHAFNYSLLGVTGFETMARLIEACDCYAFTYGDLHQAVALLANLARSPHATLSYL